MFKITHCCLSLSIVLLEKNHLITPTHAHVGICEADMTWYQIMSQIIYRGNRVQFCNVG